MSQISRSLLFRAAPVALLAILAACGNDQGASTQAATDVAPRATTPADPQLAEIYNRSCRSCHAQGAAQAPLTGDRGAWVPRLEQGMDVLLDHTISGYNGMPPMGMCFDCGEEEFIALIRFMSAQ